MRIKKVCFIIYLRIDKTSRREGSNQFIGLSSTVVKNWRLKWKVFFWFFGLNWSPLVAYRILWPIFFLKTFFFNKSFLVSTYLSFFKWIQSYSDNCCVFGRLLRHKCSYRCYEIFTDDVKIVTEAEKIVSKTLNIGFPHHSVGISVHLKAYSHFWILNTWVRGL